MVRVVVENWHIPDQRLLDHTALRAANGFNTRSKLHQYVVAELVLDPSRFFLRKAQGSAANEVAPAPDDENWLPVSIEGRPAPLPFPAYFAGFVVNAVNYCLNERVFIRVEGKGHYAVVRPRIYGRVFINVEGQFPDLNKVFNFLLHTGQRIQRVLPSFRRWRSGHLW